MRAELWSAPSPARQSWRRADSLVRSIVIVSILAVAAVLLRTTATPQSNSPAGLMRATDVWENVLHAVIPIDFALGRMYLPLVMRNGSTQ